MRYKNIPEEELKSRVGEDYFSGQDCKTIVGKIDFCVLPKKIPGQLALFEEQSLLWAEAKANRRDIVAMFAQLILTIGKARTFDKKLPPKFLGAFDAEKIAFVDYGKAQHLFYQNDFNWNVAPSNHETKEFAEIKALVEDVLASEKHVYFFGKDDCELRFFIKNNLAKAPGDAKIQIDKNNFVPVYLRWHKEILPLINFNFAVAKEKQLVASDFYLADLFVDDRGTRTLSDDVSIKEDLFVVFRNENYEITKENLRVLFDATVHIRDKNRYAQFWSRYKRPPVSESQDYIIKRRDLLVPQDIRERKGAFFTPRRWVELSQEYLAKVLGENWQDEYYIWDCCAGTGNLLAGLTNKQNIFASTLDQADVNIMKDRIKNGANLFESNVFQFDFLNDVFFDNERNLYDENGKKIRTEFTASKLPLGLQNILKDPEKRKKLLIYVNPPYAEAGNARNLTKTGTNKTQTATNNLTHERYYNVLGLARRELFTQFLMRMYCEIDGCKIANFSKLKNLQGGFFAVFRENFQAKLQKLFLLPADTFDNVKGQFPIGFFIWDTAEKENFKEIIADVYDGKANRLPPKTISSYDSIKRINDWIANYRTAEKGIGGLISDAPDFQHNKLLNIANRRKESSRLYVELNTTNLMPASVYFAVRHCIKPTWINDRDQFLHPKDSWKRDVDFHNDCLVFTLFHGQNRITSKEGVNHWIPFTEDEIGNTKARFESHFMNDFINGRITKSNGNGDLFSKPKVENGIKCKFSPEGQDVFDTGRELWRYYHSQKDVNVNASFYDIREHFQGRNEKGKMNNKSLDEKYNELMTELREKLNILAEKIAEKVYEHGFLRR